MNLALQATRYAPRRLATPADRRVHLVGVAGAEMQALADVLLAKGWRVTGADLAAPPRWLWAAGARTFRGHSADNVTANTDLLVHSDVVGPENIERRRAAELGVRQLSYPRMLGELMTGGIGLAVAGSHGKSTTTALTAAILSAAGLDATVVGGGTPLGADSGGHRGSGRHVLVEACGHRGNFLHLSPRMAVILGIEADDFDCFASPEEVEAVFTQFARRLPSGGVLVVNSDCPVARRVAEKVRCRVATFGLEPRADWQAQWLHSESGRYRFELAVHGNALAEVVLRVPGRHNVVNALAAACLASQVGVDAEAIVAALKRFSGLKRRLERVGFWRGAVWFDDCAHHPTEIQATLNTVREMFPSRRVWCIFQPHQISRTHWLLDELAGSLKNADRVAVADAFEGRESHKDEGRVDAANLAERARALGADVLDEHRLEEIFEAVAAAIRGGDILLTLGAGDIRDVWNASTGRLRNYRAAG